MMSSVHREQRTRIHFHLWRTPREARYEFARMVGGYAGVSLTSILSPVRGAVHNFR